MLAVMMAEWPSKSNGSANALVTDAKTAAGIGLAGVCFHVGYQKGHDVRDDALDAVARKLGQVIEKLPPGEGTINEGLRRLRAHPLFAPLPCILEMGWEAAERGIKFLTA